MALTADRILTTHAGSLPRPRRLAALHARRARGEVVDEEEFVALSGAAAADVVARQIATGLSVVNDGEVARESFFTHLRHRMSGFGGRSERRAMADLARYPSYLAELQRQRSGGERVDLLAAPRAIGEVRYQSFAPLESELSELERLLGPHAGRYTDAFVTSPSPGIVAAAMENAHYDDLETYVGALGEALAGEYRAIVARGFVLQVDAPDLALERHTLFQDKSLPEFLDFVRVVVRAINGALDGIPPERVRLHVCWGNYEGAHDLDVALADVWPEVSKVRAAQFLLSMANPRHSHEYRVFETGCLPPNATLVAGVIDTTSNYVEHPEAVADRISLVVRAVGDPRRVCAGTDCGFESSAGTTAVVEEIAWAKLRSLVEGAALATARLF